MPIKTLMRDNKKSKVREAWQNGKLAARWRKDQVDEMHREAPKTVPVWGYYPDIDMTTLK